MNLNVTEQLQGNPNETRKEREGKSIENYRINEPTLGDDKLEGHLRFSSNDLSKCGMGCVDLFPFTVYRPEKRARGARALNIFVLERTGDIPTQRR